MFGLNCQVLFSSFSKYIFPGPTCGAQYLLSSESGNGMGAAGVSIRADDRG